MAELFIVGQLEGATNFEGKELFCRWAVAAGDEWRVLAGRDKGQTQTDHSTSTPGLSVWSHPIDLHYATSTLRGWPKLRLEVYTLDGLGRVDIAGYGTLQIPTSPGTYDLTCPCWRPQGTISDRIASFFLGGNPQLKDEEFVTSSEDRFRLRTIGTGSVHVSLNILSRGFADQSVEL